MIAVELIYALSNYQQTARDLVSGLVASEEMDRITITELIRTASIPHIRKSEAITVMEILERHQVVQKGDSGWHSIYTKLELDSLGYALFGAQAQKLVSDVELILETPEIVLTRPKAPSRLAGRISADTSLSVSIENTDDAFASLAASACKSLTIMTPFLDEVGAKWAISLFDAAGEEVSKELILRFLSDSNSDLYPEGLPSIIDDLRRLEVKIYDFAVPREDTPNFFETFHAKIICADGKRAYVGSANLSRHSKETSMELGMLVSGSVAANVQRILDKVRAITTA